MIYRGPDFIEVVWFGSSPTSFPLSHLKGVSLAHTSCVSPVELTDGKWGRMALNWKFGTYIFRNETARPRSQFLHSCICRKIGGQSVRIYKSLTDTWMWKLETKPRSFIWEYINWILCAVGVGEKPNTTARQPGPLQIIQDSLGWTYPSEEAASPPRWADPRCSRMRRASVPGLVGPPGHRCG